MSDHTESQVAATQQLSDSQGTQSQSDNSQGSRRSSITKRRATLTSPKKQPKKRNKKKDGKDSTSDSTARTYWTDEHLASVIRWLQSEKAKGRMAEGGFKKETWKKILKALKKKYVDLRSRKEFEWSKVRGRYDTIKRSYMIFKKHQQHVSGWSRVGELPESIPEEMASHAVAYPECAKWLYKVPPFFIEMDELLEGRTATGRYARLPGDNAGDSAADDEISSDSDASSSMSNGAVESDQDAEGSDSEDIRLSTERSEPATPSPSASSRTAGSKQKEQRALSLLKQATTNTSMRGAARIAAAMSKSSDSVSQAMKDAATIFANAQEASTAVRQGEDMVDQAMDIVSEMEDLPMADRSYIMELFTEQQARIFLKMRTEERREEWIKMKLDNRDRFMNYSS
jgi:hypothetical protein